MPSGMDSRLLSALVSRWERKADSREELIAEIEALADAAWAKIQAGAGEVVFVRSTSQAAHAVTLEPTAKCDEVFALMEEALAFLGADEAPTRITYADFTNARC
jgi:hypothetical protein